MIVLYSVLILSPFQCTATITVAIIYIYLHTPQRLHPAIQGLV